MLDTFKFVAISVGLWAAGFLAVSSSHAEQTPLYVAGKEGIYLFLLDSQTGALQSKGKAAEVSSPAFLARHPQANLLYCTNNDGDAEERSTSHAISFFRVPGSGELIQLSEVPTRGTTSAYIELDSKGRFAVVANYRWGTVALFKMEPDGRIGPLQQLVEHQGSSVVLPRQSSPLPHSARISPDDMFVYVPDLGTDEVFIYGLDAKEGKLTAPEQYVAKIQEGSGPRHFDFHPTGDFAYLINEISSTITVFDRDPKTGGLIAKQTLSTLPRGYRDKNSTAEIRVHPTGRFLYGSNRGHDSIAVFTLASATGVASPVEFEPTQGKTPRHFALHPNGKWLVAGNQGSDTLIVFAIDSTTGALEPVGELTDCPGPRCLLFMP